MIENVKSELFFLKQFGFSSKLLEAIFLFECNPINAVFDTWSLENFQVNSEFTTKDRNLSKSYDDYLYFKTKTLWDDPFLEKNKNNKIFFKYDKNFITELLSSEMMPLFMYCKGDYKLLDKKIKKIAIVGTRKPSEKAKENAKMMTAKYSELGYVIVSGLAEGIDTLVHNTALLGKGKTISVLPTNFNSIYPKKNRELAEEISLRGLLMSSIGPFEKTYRSTFLERNKYVAGISDEILVIETNDRSGTMNTIRNASELGKKISFINQKDENINSKIINMGGIMID